MLLSNKFLNRCTVLAYDSLHRLEKYTFNQYDDNTFTTLIDTQSKDYLYDSIGNMMFKEGVGAYTYGENTAGPHAVTTAGDHTFDYDINGNMLFKGNLVTQQTNFYKWDVDNRLSKVSNNISGNKVEFVYDHSGKRVKKINDVSGNTIYASSFYEIAPSGTITKHIFDGVRRIVSRQKIDANPANDTKYWFHTDHLGSTGLLTKDDGTVIQETTYYPFGETKEHTGDENTQYKFTGQEYDSETGLYYYNARYYDPEIGRFISSDTIIPDPYDSQSFNRYSYVRNNPVVYSDPSGHFPLLAILIGAAVGSIIGGTHCDPFSKEAWQNFDWGSAGIGAVIGGVAGYGAAELAGALFPDGFKFTISFKYVGATGELTIPIYSSVIEGSLATVGGVGAGAVASELYDNNKSNEDEIDLNIPDEGWLASIGGRSVINELTYKIKNGELKYTDNIIHDQLDDKLFQRQLLYDYNKCIKNTDKLYHSLRTRGAAMDNLPFQIRYGRYHIQGRFKGNNLIIKIHKDKYYAYKDLYSLIMHQLVDDWGLFK